MGRLTKDWDVTLDPSSLRVPILLAHGRYDYTVPHTLWENIETVLPTATRQLFLRSGHQPFFEEPDQFAMVVAAWMNKQDDTRDNAPPNTYQPSACQGHRSSPPGRRIKKTRDRKR